MPIQAPSIGASPYNYEHRISQIMNPRGNIFNGRGLLNFNYIEPHDNYESQYQVIGNLNDEHEYQMNGYTDIMQLESIRVMFD